MSETFKNLFHSCCSGYVKLSLSPVKPTAWLSQNAIYRARNAVHAMQYTNKPVPVMVEATALVYRSDLWKTLSHLHNFEKTNQYVYKGTLTFSSVL